MQVLIPFETVWLGIKLLSHCDYNLLLIITQLVLNHRGGLEKGQEHEKDGDDQVSDVEGRVVEDGVGQLGPPS